MAPLNRKRKAPDDDANWKPIWELWSDTKAPNRDTLACALTPLKLPSQTSQVNRVAVCGAQNAHKKLAVRKGDVLTFKNSENISNDWVGHAHAFSRWASGDSKERWTGDPVPMVHVFWLRKNHKEVTQFNFDKRKYERWIFVEGNEGTAFSYEDARSITGQVFTVKLFDKDKINRGDPIRNAEKDDDNDETMIDEGDNKDQRPSAYEMRGLMHDFRAEGWVVDMEAGNNKMKNSGDAAAAAAAAAKNPSVEQERDEAEKKPAVTKERVKVQQTKADPSIRNKDLDSPGNKQIRELQIRKYTPKDPAQPMEVDKEGSPLIESCVVDIPLYAPYGSRGTSDNIDPVLLRGLVR